MAYEDKAVHDYWGTPIELFNELDKEFNFTLDPCADRRRSLKDGIKEVNESENGLLVSWKGKRVFCNPPYSQGLMWLWVKKAYEERNLADLIVLLIPVRTDRKAFHKYIYGVCEIRFLKGRLKFYDMERNKQIPNCKHASMVCIYRKGE